MLNLNPNRLGSTNSEPPGPIIMMNQSQTLTSSQIVFITSFCAGVQRCCAFHQPQQTPRLCWAKPACFHFSSSNFNLVRGTRSLSLFFGSCELRVFRPSLLSSVWWVLPLGFFIGFFFYSFDFNVQLTHTEHCWRCSNGNCILAKAPSPSSRL